MNVFQISTLFWTHIFFQIGSCKSSKMNFTLKNELILFRNNGDIYYGVYETDQTKITLILFSIILTIFFIFPLSIAFLYYDYFGPQSERVILNRLISSLYETSLGYLIFVHLIDISRYIFGSFSGEIFIDIFKEIYILNK